MTPLFDAICKHNLLDRSSFHTPGHKNNRKFLNVDFLNLDLTELPDTDSLYDANSAILEAEKLASSLFGVERTLFSAGGCTLCIQTMLRLICPGGGKIAVGRNVHRSAVNAMALLGIDPVWILPRKNAGKYLPGRISSDDVKALLESNRDINAVYVTSPDYFGVISDINAISRECKKFDIPLVVDNAHGTHLMFLRDNLHPISLGASITACSAHKTLPVLTGGAYLNINDERFTEEAKDAMSLFGSTSPSYPIMVSLDLCTDWLNRKGKNLFVKLQDRVKNIKNIILKKGLKIPDGLCDPVRICFSAVDIGYSGHEISYMLRNSGIEPEYANDCYVVLIATPMNSEEDFCKLENFIANLDTRSSIKVEDFEPFLPDVHMSPREALTGKCEIIKVHKAKGRVSAEILCPCPPGVPVVMPGEVINEEFINLFLKNGQPFVKVVL